MLNVITVFTDGSSRGNPGPGGWGAIIINNEQLTIKNGGAKVWELGGREDHTTNNRMELSAALEALVFIEKRKLEGTVEIYTDSAYLLGGVTGWMYGWEKNGWKTKDGKDVLNQDIWKELGAILFRMKQKRNVEWKKVSGHAGHRGNERADVIATSAADQAQQVLFVGSLSAYEKMLGGSVFEFIEGAPAKKLTKQKSSKAAFSYVSMVGGLIEVHKTWGECEKRVKGKKGARFQKVFSSLEEKELIESWTNDTLGRYD